MNLQETMVGEAMLSVARSLLVSGLGLGVGTIREGRQVLYCFEFVWVVILLLRAREYEFGDDEARAIGFPKG